jgi:transcriptional regulator with XRE-family HTH domain
MRLRVPELLTERDWSAYKLAQELETRGVAPMTAYRLARGTAVRFDANVLAALADVFGIPDAELGPLFTRKPLPAKPRPPRGGK